MSVPNTVLAALVALFAAGPVSAAEPSFGGETSAHFIAGLGLGLEASNLEEWGEAQGGGLNYEYSSGGIGSDLYVGAELMKWLSLRLGHHRFGDQEADVYSGPLYAGEVKLEADGSYFAVDALYPVNQQVLIGLTLGSLNWDGDLTAASSAGSVFRGSESGRDGFAGLRGRVLINNGKAAITAFLNSYTLDTEDTSKDLEYGSVGIGIELRL